MAESDPPFVIYRGSDTTLAFKLLDENDQPEDLTEMSNATIVITVAAGVAPLLTYTEVAIDVPSSQISTVILASDSVTLPLGILVVGATAIFDSGHYQVDPVYCRVMDKVA
jgi:hypothetical protein